MSEQVRDRWSGAAAAIGDLKSDRVVAVLEQQILSGDLAPGTTLPVESELCELLGVSRTVLRDAVRALVARGLLRVRQGRGTTVAEPSDEAYTTALIALLARSELSVGAVMDARQALEVMIVRLAAVAGDDEDWRDLDRIESELMRAIAASDAAAAQTVHAEFHVRILQATRQPALAVMLAPMHRVALLTATSTVGGDGTEDWDLAAHRAIVDALRLGDADAAEAAMRAHFEGVEQRQAYREAIAQPFARASFPPVV